MSIAEEIEKLQKLHADGVMTNEEFDNAKKRLLAESTTDPAGQAAPPTPATGGAAPPSAQDTNMWAMILHLSQLAGLVVPVAGFAAPIVIWQIKKAEMPSLDAHGKMVTNWLISYAIYFAICFVLVFVIVGALLMPALVLVGIIFAIIGGIKANNGELWNYPLTIKFLK